MRSFRLLAAGASALALFVSACSTGGAPSPTTAPAAAPTTAPAKPAAVASVSPAASPAASPATAASAIPAASPKPAASPAASPAVAVASPSVAASPVAAGGPKPTVKMGSANFGEAILLGELYSQILEANGYTIERHLNLGPRQIVEPALESGQIDMYPEYIASSLGFVTKDPNAATGDPAETSAKLQAALQPKNITVLAFSPAQDQNGFAVTKATADKYHLTKMSDLAPVADQLVFGGPPECDAPEQAFCINGLQRVYGIKFKDFQKLDAGGPQTVAALQGGAIDVGELFTTDPNISLMNFVLLDDDKHLQQADNIAPLVRNDVLSRGSDLRQLSDSVSTKLTGPDLIDMNKQVGIDHKDASAVAKAYLQSKGLVK
jgi:osmoprotectant transport system substrate-binding protein